MCEWISNKLEGRCTAMKRLLALVFALIAVAVFAPSRAEESASVVITPDSPLVPLTVTDPAFTHWLHELLNVTDANGTLPYIGYEYTLAFTFNGEPAVTYTVQDTYGDDGACVIRPDGKRYALSQDTAKMIRELTLGRFTFAIPEEHRMLMANHGWTVAFRHPCMLAALPTELTVSRTDMGQLYFTYAELFMRGGGYDITPCLGQAVVPYVYAVLERVDPHVWDPNTRDESCETVCAVVLEHDGEVIGAYITSAYGDGRQMLTLDGKGPLELLEGMSIREFLLSRLPITEAETEMAAQSMEEIARRFGETRSPQLMDIEQLLAQSGNIYMGSLFTYGSFVLPDTGSNVISAEHFLTDAADEVCKVRWVDGTTYFPHMIYESPETGWKIMSYFNTLW